VHTRYVCIALIVISYIYILFLPCILFKEPPFLSLDFLLVALRIFYRYILGMIEKACAAFLSWYSQTSLPKDRFALTYMLCIYIFYFPFIHLFFFFFFYFKKKKKKKNQKKGKRMQIFIVPLYSFLDILCTFN